MPTLENPRSPEIHLKTHRQRTEYRHLAREEELVAMSNSSHDAHDEYRCEEVVAIKDGDRYTGWVKIWNFSDESVVLLNAEGPDGERIGQTSIISPDVVEFKYGGRTRKEARRRRRN